jgi:hypothetical protein
MKTDYKAQVPAMGIAQTNQIGDSASYRIQCECGSSDHATDMWIEVEHDTDLNPYVMISFYVTTYTPVWASAWQRICAAWHMLVYGVNTQTHEMLLKPRAAENFAGVLRHYLAAHQSQDTLNGTSADSQS